MARRLTLYILIGMVLGIVAGFLVRTFVPADSQEFAYWLRSFGMLAGIDLQPLEKPGLRGHLVQKRLFDAGLHLKTTGDAAILAPAFIATTEEIDRIAAILRDTLAECR